MADKKRDNRKVKTYYPITLREIQNKRNGETIEVELCNRHRKSKTGLARTGVTVATKSFGRSYFLWLCLLGT